MNLEVAPISMNIIGAPASSMRCPSPNGEGRKAKGFYEALEFQAKGNVYSPHIHICKY